MSCYVMNMSWITLDLNNGSFGPWLPSSGNIPSSTMDVSPKPLNTFSSQNFTIVQNYTTSRSSPSSITKQLLQVNLRHGQRPGVSPLHHLPLLRGWGDGEHFFYSTSLTTFTFLCQIAGLTSVSVQSVKDFLFDEELILLVTGRAFAQFFIFLVAIVPIYLFAITLYPTIREVLPSQSERQLTNNPIICKNKAIFECLSI